MDTTLWITPALYGLALVLMLVVASRLTPARWWRRPTAANLALLGGGTAALGWCLAALLVPAAVGGADAVASPMAGASPPVAAPARGSRPPAGLRLRAHDHLNLRSTPGTAAPRLAVIPTGTVVTATGKTQGDWWQISAQVDGQRVSGWSSSLWLRQPGEHAD